MNSKSTTVAKGVHEWLKWYEGALGQEEDNRIRFAEQFYEKYKGQ